MPKYRSCSWAPARVCPLNPHTHSSPCLLHFFSCLFIPLHGGLFLALSTLKVTQSFSVRATYQTVYCHLVGKLSKPLSSCNISVFSCARLPLSLIRGPFSHHQTISYILTSAHSACLKLPEIHSPNISVFGGVFSYSSHTQSGLLSVGGQSAPIWETFPPI